MASLERTVPYLGIEWQVQAGTTTVGQACEIVAVRRVIAESPACKAGMREGDIIRGVDGTPLDVENTLSALITSKKPGAVVTLELTRAGKRMHLKVTLGARTLPAFKFRPIEYATTQKESVDVRN